MMTDMDTHDEAAAADFELGWSGERIAAARRAWGLAVSDGLPAVSYTHLTLPTICSV